MDASGEYEVPGTQQSSSSKRNDQHWSMVTSDLGLADSLAELIAVRNLATPCQFVLDTEFFYSAFQYELDQGRCPLSLREAMKGSIRLYMASATMAELREKKILEFSNDLSVPPEVLSQLLRRWEDWITEVDIPAEHEDPRIVAVSQRDPSDRPAAVLASILAPCMLVTNDKDFQAYGVDNSIRHVIIFEAAVELSWALVEMHAILKLPELPLRGAIMGVGWAAERLKVSPMVIIAGISLLGFIAYRAVSDESRTTIKTTTKSIAKNYADGLNRAQAAERLARTSLQQRVVVPAANRSREDNIIRALALIDYPISAQELWGKLQSGNRPSVNRVREVLRTHPSSEAYGRGIWTFGNGLPK